ncbi:MAG: AhpC/TSA family protein [Ferruginibacter sp.]
MIQKLILFSIISAHSYILNAQQIFNNNKFTFSGIVNGEDTNSGKKMIFLQMNYKGQNGQYIKDTCYLKNGRFVFSGYINGPTDAYLQGDNQKSGSIEDMIFLEPTNMQGVLVENDFKDAKINGSVTQYEFEKLKKEKQSNKKTEDKLNMELKEVDKLTRNGDTSMALKNKRELIWNRYLSYREEDKKIDYAFISTHPDSYLSPYLMNYYFGGRKLSIDSAELFYNNFKKPIQESIYGKSIKDQIVARKLSLTGSAAPLFSKTDINGNEINLSSFKGKSYVLLDFWASWCVPCREITPRLKSLYQKYHSKGLDVISISWDSDKKAWLDAIAKDDTNNWYNVFADVFKPLDNGMINKYAIASIPTLILIDKNGIIVGRYRGDGEDGDEAALFNKLDEIFASK